MLDYLTLNHKEDFLKKKFVTEIAKMFKTKDKCSLPDIEEYMERLMKKYEDILVNINALEESQSLKVIGFRISGSTVI